MTTFSLTGCTGTQSADVYTVSVDPYVPVGEEDVRFGECTITLGDEVNVCGQGAWYKDNSILISKGGIYKISGSYTGDINVCTSDPVKLMFVNADISNSDGYAVTSCADKLIIESDGTCSITGSGGTYCNAVYSDGSVIINGIGDMDINGGILSRGGIKFGKNVRTICEILRTDEGDVISGVLSLN